MLIYINENGHKTVNQMRNEVISLTHERTLTVKQAQTSFARVAVKVLIDNSLGSAPGDVKCAFLRSNTARNASSFFNLSHTKGIVYKKRNYFLPRPDPGIKQFIIPVRVITRLAFAIYYFR